MTDLWVGGSNGRAYILLEGGEIFYLDEIIKDIAREEDLYFWRRKYKGKLVETGNKRGINPYRIYQ